MTHADKYRIHTDTDNDANIEPDPASDWPYLCAMSLLKHSVDQAISEQLALMGETSNVDRSWMLEYRPDMHRFRNTHEWCRDQIKPFVAELQDVPTTLIGWLHRHMVKRHSVAIHDVTGLPRTARTIQVEFLRQGNKSVLSVPIFHDGKLYGIIGFDTTVKYRSWSTAEVDALRRCANLIGQTKYANSRDQNRAAMYESSTPLIYLSTRGVVQGVQPESIAGVRSAGNYSEISLVNGSMVLDSRALGIWSTLLPETIFLRIHRTAIVNVLHVVDVDRRSVDRWLIRVRSTDRTWPVSRAYRKALRERMGI